MLLYGDLIPGVENITCLGEGKNPMGSSIPDSGVHHCKAEKLCVGAGTCLCKANIGNPGRGGHHRSIDKL